MVSQPQAFFTATEEEHNLALQILEAWGTNGILQGENAKEVFNRSALPHATLRMIWGMSDCNATGNLSKDEVAKALRLIGRVQAGETLHEGLLASAGPLPTLDGITDVEYKSQRKPRVPQTPISSAVNDKYVQEFKTIFLSAGPENGFLSEEKVLNVYMAADLSYEDIRSIINLVTQSSQYGLNYTEFACGLYFVRALQSSQLHSVPKSIPQHLLDRFRDSPLTPPSLPRSATPPPPTTRRLSTVSLRPLAATDMQISSSSKLPARSVSPSPRLSQIGSSLSWHNGDYGWVITPHDRNLFEHYFRKLDESDKGYLEREDFEVFVSVYRVPPADLSRIWELTNFQNDGHLKPDEFTVAMQLVKQRSAGKELPATLPESILPPSLRSKSSSISLAKKISTKRPPPPLPPKRRDSIMKGILASPNASAHLASPPTPTYTIPLSPPISPLSSEKPEKLPVISVSNPPSPPSQIEKVKSPFEDPAAHPATVDDVPAPRYSLLPPTYPDGPHQETLDQFRNEISRLSQQVENLLRQLAAQSSLRDANDTLRLENEGLKTKVGDTEKAQNSLRDTNDALQLENEILKMQVKDTEKMMTDILTANESESAGSRERHAQDITRLVGELAEKEAQCEECDRKIAVLTEDEKRLREKMREMDGTLAKHVADEAGYQELIESQKREIAELNGRVGDMTRAMADEPDTGRNGTTSNRELRVLIRDVTRENEGLKGQVRDMQRSMEQLLLSTKHARYDEMDRENKKLKKQVSELEMVVTQMQSSASAGASLSRQGRSPLGQRPSSSSMRSQNSENLVKENEQLKSQLQDGKRSFADYRSSSETKMVELQQKIDTLSQENNRLKLDIHESLESRRLGQEGSQEDSSVPPPAYDESFAASTQ